MSIRGAYGFRVNGEDKITYNYFDSYPEGLGINIINFIKETSKQNLQKIAEDIILVKEDSVPTKEQVEACKQFYNGDVSSQCINDWYCLLRNSQGDLIPYCNGLKYMIDSHAFLKDSLSCEWAYIINLDTGNLEVYRGWNQEPNGLGRYANLKTEEKSEYYGVRLIAVVNLNEVQEATESKVNKFMEQVDELADTIFKGLIIF
jgi:hypothetical protein